MILGINAQFYDERKQKIQVVCLQCREILDRHFGDNIETWMKDSLTEFKVDLLQLLGVSVDRAANITKGANLLVARTNSKFAKELSKIRDAAMDESETEELIQQGLIEEIHAMEEEDENANDDDSNDSLFESTDQLETFDFGEILRAYAFRISCLVHQLQLGVMSFIGDEVLDILEEARRLSKHLRGSVIMILMRDEKVKYSLIDQVTRWNSTYLMIERLLTLKPFCIKYQATKGCEKLYLPNETWEKIHALSKILAPPAAATKSLQSEQLLVSDAVCHWLLMMGKLENLCIAGDNTTVKRLAKKLLTPLKARWEIIKKNTIIISGWYLDKKLNAMLNEDEKTSARSFILMIARKMKLIEADTENDEEQDIPEQEILDNEDEDLLENLIGSVGKQQQRQEKPRKGTGRLTKLKNEIEDYEKLPRITAARPNNLKWWNERSKDFPLLSRIALVTLSVPVTEVSVERLFSHLKIVVSDRRTNLRSEIIEAILFLRINKKFDM